MKGLRSMSFEELYHTYVDAVYGFLMFKLNNKYLVEDIVQETFLAIYQNPNQLHGVEFPKAWILKIAHHKMVDHLRKRQVVEQNPLVEQLPDVSCEPETNLFLEETLNKSEDTEGTIVYGLYVENLSCQELAQILQIPEGTVKSKAYYARKRLRE